MSEPRHDELVVGVLAGEAAAVARLLTLVERGEADLQPLHAALAARPRDTQVIGITGPPGAGKSVLVGRLIAHYLERGARVGALLVDPSSPITGGALLGDRLRIDAPAADPRVFVRSMATRGTPGGLAAGVAGGIVVLLASGADVVLVESVGAGQGDLDISGLVDSLVLVHLPGAGDAVQLEKAGLIEVADVHVVNKADLGTPADRLADELAAALAPRVHGDAWAPPVLRTVATEDRGIDLVLDALDDHRHAAERRGRAGHEGLAAAEILAAADRLLRAQLAGTDARKNALVASVARGGLRADDAARRLFAALGGEVEGSTQDPPEDPPPD